MALTFNPAAAGTTAVLFIGPPAFTGASQIAEKFLAPKAPRMASWLQTLLYGGGFGFGAVSMAAAISPSLALLPAVAYGAAGGAILFAAARAAGLAVKKTVAVIEQRFPRTQSFFAKVKGLWSKLDRPVRFAQSLLNLAIGIGQISHFRPVGRAMAGVTPTSGLPRTVFGGMVTGVIANRPYAMTESPFRWTTTLTWAMFAVKDYLLRSGTEIVVRGVRLFTVRQMWVVLFLVSAFNLWRGVMAVKEFVAAFLAARKGDSDDSALSNLVDAAAEAEPQPTAPAPSSPTPAAAAAGHITQAQFDAMVEEFKTVMNALAEENIQDLTASADELLGEIRAEQAKLGPDALARLNANAATMTAQPLIAPITDEEIAARQPVRMGGTDVVSQAMERGTLPAQPVVEEASAKRRPFRAKGQKKMTAAEKRAGYEQRTARSKTVHTSQSEVVPPAPAAARTA